MVSKEENEDEREQCEKRSMMILMSRNTTIFNDDMWH